MKKSITACLLAIIAVFTLTSCKNAVNGEKTIETANTAVQVAEWEIESYYMNGEYNPVTKELYTVDAAGNSDVWDDIEISFLDKDLDYWNKSDEGFCSVWVRIDTVGTRAISDDLAMVTPGYDLDVYSSNFGKVYNINGEIFTGEEVEK